MGTIEGKKKKIEKKKKNCYSFHGQQKLDIILEETNGDEVPVSSIETLRLA